MQGNGARARTMANASAVAAGRDRQSSVRVGDRVTRAGTLTPHDPARRRGVGRHDHVRRQASPRTIVSPMRLELDGGAPARERGPLSTADTVLYCEARF